MSLRNDRIFVSAGKLAVGSRSSILTAVGLGSCIGVAIDDPFRTIGGLAHIFLPRPIGRGSEDMPARYALTAVPLLVERVLASGAERSNLRARLAGGANIFPELQPPGTEALGSRNASVVREALAELSIPIVGEDLGGTHGRTVALHLADGRFVVRSARAPELIL